LKIKLIGINARYSHLCLALFYLRNKLEDKIGGVETEICQYTINDPYYTLLQRIAGRHADYFFFSVLIWNSDLVERLIDDLLQISSHQHIVVGGPQAGVVVKNFADYRQVSLFNGEIEAAADSFFDDLKQGNLQKSYQASFLKSGLKELHYLYRAGDFDLHLQNRAVYYESSRGCPFFCSYCLSSTEKGVFHKDLDQVFKELDDI